MVKCIGELYMVAHAIKPVVNYASYWGHIFSSLDQTDGSKLSEIAKRVTFIGLHLFAGALLFTRNHSLTSVLLILAYLSDDMQKHPLRDDSSDFEESSSSESHKKNLDQDPENSLHDQSAENHSIDQPQPSPDNSSDHLQQPLQKEDRDLDQENSMHDQSAEDHSIDQPQPLQKSDQESSLPSQSGEEHPINQPQPLLTKELIKPDLKDSEEVERAFEGAWEQANSKREDNGAPNSDQALEEVWSEANTATQANLPNDLNVISNVSKKPSKINPLFSEEEDAWFEVIYEENDMLEDISREIYGTLPETELDKNPSAQVKKTPSSKAELDKNPSAQVKKIPSPKAELDKNTSAQVKKIPSPKAVKPSDAENKKALHRLTIISRF